ncbi:MAG: LysR family transcriptional regulator [Alphaproteobacteria bacterium]|nr:LysR family transcriptional regulator [Alphaproteobacteria bacterium]
MSVQKRTSLPDWEDVRAFAAVVRLGSLSAAARELGLNHATVARRLAALERSLGAAAVQRTRTGYMATATGARLIEPAQRMEMAADAFGRSVGPAAADVTGDVRITLTEAIANLVVAPRLGELRRRHPGLRLDLVSDDRVLSLARREAEVAIRWARPDRGELVARRIADVPYALFRGRGLPLTAADPLTPLIGHGPSRARLPEAQWMARAFPDRTPAIRTTGLPAQIALVRGGAGLGVLPSFVQRLCGDIEPVEAPIPPPVRSLWLVVHRDLRRRPAIAAVSDFLRAIVADALRAA